MGKQYSSVKSVEEQRDKEKMKNCDIYDGINSDRRRYHKSLNMKTPQEQENHFVRRSLIVGNRGGRHGLL